MPSGESTPHRKAQKTKYEFKRTGEVFDNVVEYLSDPPKEIEMPTGIRSIDARTFGFKRGRLAIMAGRPGNGKTTWAVQTAWHLAKMGKKPFFFSLEMSADEIIMKILSMELKIDYSILMNPINFNDSLLQRVKAAKQMFYKSQMALFDDVGYMFDGVTDVLDDFAQMNIKPDICFVDHVQMVRKQSKFQAKNEAIEEYCRKSKEYAKRHNVAFCLLSQISREGVSRRNYKPTVEHLKGSGGIEENADVIFIGSKNPKDPSDYCFDIAKQRHGTTGEVELTFQPEYSRFVEKGGKPYEDITAPMINDEEGEGGPPFFEVI